MLVAESITLRVYKHAVLVDELSTDRNAIKIGRLSSSALRLDDESVSRMHAVIENDGGVLSIVDLGSTGGVKVCGSRVSKHQLKLDDEFQIGNFLVVVAGVGNQMAPARQFDVPSAKDKLRGSGKPKGFFSKLFRR